MFQVENSTYAWGAIIDQNYSGSSANFGHYVDIANTGTAVKFAQYIELNGTASNSNQIYGSYVFMNGTDGVSIGYLVDVNTASSDIDYGFYAVGEEQNYFSGNLSLGTLSSVNKLDVEGAVAIGASYSGISAAPTNGLIVEGQTGIGTTSPLSTTQFEVENSSFTRTSFIDHNYSGSSLSYGQYIDMAASGTGVKFGHYTDMRGTSGSSSNIYGHYIRMNGTDGVAIGCLVDVTTASSNVDYGFYAIGEEQNYLSGNLTIGSLTSVNKLDVEGAAAIGSGYSGSSTAPTNGLIVEGNVGIGENNPQTTLDVADFAVIGNTSVGSQSTDQASSNENGLGFLTTPWVYSHAIEAPDERGSGSTLITIGNDGTYGASDQINFVTSGSSRFFIDSNGEIGAGITNPTRDFHVLHTSGGADDGLAVENASGGGDIWHFYTWLGNDLGLFFNGTHMGSFDDVDGSYSTTSDERLKKNITTRSGLLNPVMQLRVAEYHFRNQDDSSPKELGLIAQEVLPLFPHLVTQPATGGEEGTSYYALDYSGLSVLAIGALQEQQQIITTQDQRIATMEAQIKQLQAQLLALQNQVGR